MAHDTKSACQNRKDAEDAKRSLKVFSRFCVLYASAVSFVRHSNPFPFLYVRILLVLMAEERL